MTVFVAVLGYQGIVENVSVHQTLGAAMNSIGEHIQSSGFTAQEWFDSFQESNDYPSEEYEPTNIYKCELLN